MMNDELNNIFIIHHSAFIIPLFPYDFTTNASQRLLAPRLSAANGRLVRPAWEGLAVAKAQRRLPRLVE
jgi:hypothetical protein